MKVIVIVLLALLLNVSLNSFAQMKKLSIGDRFPDITLNGVLNFKDSVVRLSDYRGKIILLDIWSNWCKSCIEKMPHLKELQAKFKDSIKIFTVNPFSDKKDVLKLLMTNKIAKNVDLPCITDTLLNMKNYLDYNSIPHLVWIGTDGTVKAFTHAQYATEKNIKELLKGNKIAWRMKTSHDFDAEIPLLSIREDAIKEPVYYTTLTGDFEGDEQARSPILLTKDSAKGYARSCHVNADILTLYKRTLMSDHPEILMSPNRWVLEVKDSSKYFYDSKKEYYNVWSSKNVFCYEAILPISTTQTEFEGIMQKDLNQYLRLNARIERRLVPCIIVEKNIDSPAHKINASLVNEFISVKISELIQELNKIPGELPIIFGNKNIEENMISIDKTTYSSIYTNPLRVKQELKLNGFDLFLTKKEIEMFVITER